MKKSSIWRAIFIRKSRILISFIQLIVFLVLSMFLRCFESQFEMSGYFSIEDANVENNERSWTKTFLSKYAVAVVQQKSFFAGKKQTFGIFKW